MSNEIWRPVEGFSNYEVSNTGKVRWIKNSKELTVYGTYVGLRRDGKTLNRGVAKLVWAAFSDEPVPDRVVTKDGSHDYSADNLVEDTLQNHSPSDYQHGKPCIDQPGEVWKAIPNFPGYEVSNQGRVRSYRIQYTESFADTPVLVSPATTTHGYQMLLLRRDGKSHGRRVHRLVLEAFVGSKPFPAAQTRHLDGNPGNNHLDNLKWGTAKENGEDRVRHGTSRLSGAKGSAVHNSIFTENEIAVIKQRLAGGEWYVDVAKEFDLPISTIHYIGSGKGWKHVLPGLDCTPGMRRKGTVPLAAVEDMKAGARPVDVAYRYDVSQSGLTRAFKRATGMLPRDWHKANKVGAV